MNPHSPLEADLLVSRPDCYTATSNDRLRVPFGLSRQDRHLHAPNEVPSGAACGCVCPGCGAPLIAKHARQSNRTWHFAHAPGSQCATGFETSVHLAAKQLIAQERRVFLPELSATAELIDTSQLLRRKHLSLAPAGVRFLEDVRLEAWCDGIRPDVVATPSGTQPIAVEIAVTSFVGPEKLARFREQSRPAVEYDLRHLRHFTWDALRDALIAGQGPAKWCYHPEVERARERLIETLRAEIRAAEQMRKAPPVACDKHDFDLEYQRSVLTETTEKRRKVASAQQAPRFRERSWADKAELVCRAFDVPALPDTLRFAVTNEYCVNPNEDPAVWQAALFGGLVHRAAARGEPCFALETAFQWLCERFDIMPPLEDQVRVAVGAYLLALADAGALLRTRRGEYRVRVASLTAFEALQAHRNHQVSEEAGLTWARSTDWPTLSEAQHLVPAHAEEVEPSAHWRKVSKISIEVANQSLTEALARLMGPLPPRAVLTYWIAAGFVRRAHS